MSRQANSVIRVTPRHLIPLRFSPDGQYILIYDELQESLNLQTLEGKPHGTPIKTPDDCYLSELRLNKDASVLLCKGSLYDTKSGRHLSQLYRYDDYKLRGPVVSPDLTWIACSVPPRLCRWDGTFRDLPIPKESKIIAFTPDSKACLILQDKTMQFVDLNGKHIGEEMELMVSGSEWSATKLAETDKRYDRSWKPVSVQFDKEGTKLVTSHPFAFCRLWSTAGAPLSPWIENHTESAVLSPDGKLLVTYSRAIEGRMSISTPELDPREEGYFAIIRETSNGKELHRNQVYDPSREFSSDSKLLPQYIKDRYSYSSEPPEVRIYEATSKFTTSLPYWRMGYSDLNWTEVGFCGDKMIQVDAEKIRIEHLSNLPHRAMPVQNAIDCQSWRKSEEKYIELEFNELRQLAIIRAHAGMSCTHKSVILSLRDSIMPSLVQRAYYADSSSLSSGFDHGEELPSYRLLIKAIASDDLDEALARTSKIAGLNLEVLNDCIRFHLPGQRDECSIFTEHRPNGVSLSPDFKRLAVATDEEISIWDTSTQRKLWRGTLSQPADRLCFTADGRGLVLIFEGGSSSSDNWLEIWDGGKQSLLGDFHASALALMPQIERDFEQLWKRIEDGEFTNEKMITWLGQSGLSPLQQWLLLPRIKSALEASDHETNYIIRGYKYRLLADSDFMMDLKRNGIVKSVFSESMLRTRLLNNTPSIEDIYSFLAERFYAYHSMDEQANKLYWIPEIKAALFLLQATEATSTRFHFFSTVFQYQQTPNTAILSKVRGLVDQGGEHESIFNAILASVLINMGSASEAEECVRRILHPNENCVRIDDPKNPFPDPAIYLIRQPNGKVSIARAGFIPSDNCRQLSKKLRQYLSPVIHWMLKSEKDKSHLHSK